MLYIYSWRRTFFLYLHQYILFLFSLPLLTPSPHAKTPRLNSILDLQLFARRPQLEAWAGEHGLAFRCVFTRHNDQYKQFQPASTQPASTPASQPSSHKPASQSASQPVGPCGAARDPSSPPSLPQQYGRQEHVLLSEQRLCSIIRPSKN